MLILFTEPSACRYLYINPLDNRVHIIVPVVSGTSIGLDNTCKAVLSVQAFFGKGSHTEQLSALAELKHYKAALQFDLSLIQEETSLKQAKAHRLGQIEDYINAFGVIQQSTILDSLQGNYPAYPDLLKTLMQRHDCNLYSIQLRPRVQDINLRTVNPRFSINRANDAAGNPLSAFYTALWSSFQLLKIQPQDTRSRLINAVLASAEANPLNFSEIQRLLTQQANALLGIKIDFNHASNGEAITEAFIRQDLGHSCAVFIRKQCPEDLTPLSGNYLFIEPQQLMYIHQDGREEAVTIPDITAFQTALDAKRYDALLLKNNNLPARLKLGSVDEIQTLVLSEEEINTFISFLTGHQPPPTTTRDFIESLLGFCAPNAFDTVIESPFYTINESDKNEAIDKLSILTQFFIAQVNVYCISKRLTELNFGTILDQSAELSQMVAARVASTYSSGASVEDMLLNCLNEQVMQFQLSTEDAQRIKTRFIEDYAEIKDSPHFDEFLLLDKLHPGLFVIHQGSIGVNLLSFLGLPIEKLVEDQNNSQCLNQAMVIPHKNEHIETSIDIDLEALNEVQLQELLINLPFKSRLTLLKTMPALNARFQQREFLQHVARGEQPLAAEILQSNPEITQQLLMTPGQLTDYSGRTFNCTAYEYAYWAKDTHMCRLLERMMDDPAKAFTLARVEAIEAHGLAYQHHGHFYQNAHYDMSFALRDLNADEFLQLKTLLRETVPKINDATEMNYLFMSFTADEFKLLNTTLESTPDNQALRNKLQFDFHSLITALNTYTSEAYLYADRKTCFLKIGVAQSEVPAHIAHEYCRPDRAFNPRPDFNEETLPRVLTITVANEQASWFPLSEDNRLGLNFALTRQGNSTVYAEWPYSGIPLPSTNAMSYDLIAVRHLDAVRIADLVQSRTNLSSSSNQLGLTST